MAWANVRDCSMTGVIPPASFSELGWHYIVGDETLDVSAHLRGAGAV
jgi:hypothetical protein